MKNIQKNKAFAVLFCAATTAFLLTACQSRPQLKQVASDAPDKAINTKEGADQLKKKYEK